MAAKMQEAGSLIANATQTIIDSAHELSVDFFKQSAKQAILDAGKDILKGTVRLQQFYELYEIVVILRQVISHNTYHQVTNTFTSSDWNLPHQVELRAWRHIRSGGIFINFVRLDSHARAQSVACARYQD